MPAIWGIAIHLKILEFCQPNPLSSGNRRIAFGHRILLGHCLIIFRQPPLLPSVGVGGYASFTSVDGRGGNPVLFVTSPCPNNVLFQTSDGLECNSFSVREVGESEERSLQIPPKGNGAQRNRDERDKTICAKVLMFVPMAIWGYPWASHLTCCRWILRMLRMIPIATMLGRVNASIPS